MRRIHPILVRYLLLFLLFSLVLLALFVPVSRYVTDFTLKNELAYMGDKLRAGLEAIDASTVALNNTLLATARDSKFRVFKYGLPSSGAASKAINPYLLTELQNTFNALLEPNTIFADAGILFSKDICLTRRRIFYYPKPYGFYGKFLQCEDLSREAWAALLSKQRPFIPARRYRSVDYGSYEAITFAARWSYAEYPNENIFFATLPLNRIIPLIADAAVAEQGYIRIYGGGGELLVSRGENSGGAFHVISDQGVVNNFRYEIGVPSRLIAEKMRPVKNLILLFALSLVFAWQSTKPVQSFLESLDTTRLIRAEYERFRENLSLNPFKSFRQIFSTLTLGISRADKELENSLRIIEEETRLLRSRMADSIRKALAEGNEAAACALLQESAAALPEPEDPLMASLVADMLIEMVKDLRQEFSGVLDEIDTPVYAPGNQKNYFENALPDCFKKIGGLIRNHREKGITKFNREVLDFIDAHITDPALYLAMVSEHFHISPPSIQKLVKNSSGQTFLAYVENRRLSLACGMLAKGGSAVAEIAARCGFSNANSFSRAFKRVYGCSPSMVLNKEVEKPSPLHF
jgi:AraC-like DNA-binding protein